MSRQWLLRRGRRVTAGRGSSSWLKYFLARQLGRGRVETGTGRTSYSLHSSSVAEIDIDRGWWREVAGDKRGVLGPVMTTVTSLQRCESKRPLHLMTVLDVPITAAPGWCPALQQRSHRTLGVVIPRAGPGSQAWAGRCSRSAKVSAKVAAKVTRDPDTAAQQPPAETTTSSSRGGAGTLNYWDTAGASSSQTQAGAG